MVSMASIAKFITVWCALLLAAQAQLHSELVFPSETDLSDTEVANLLRSDSVGQVNAAAYHILSISRDSLEIRQALYELLDDERPGRRATNDDGSAADFGYSAPRVAALLTLASLLEYELPRSAVYVTNAPAAAAKLKAAIDANPEVLQDLDATLAGHGSDDASGAAQADPGDSEDPAPAEEAESDPGELSVPTPSPAGGDQANLSSGASNAGPTQAIQEERPQAFLTHFIWLGLGAVALAAVASLLLRRK